MSLSNYFSEPTHLDELNTRYLRLDFETVTHQIRSQYPSTSSLRHFFPPSPDCMHSCSYFLIVFVAV